MAEALKGNPGKEKALLLFEGHGSIELEHRMSVTKENDRPVPGEDFSVGALHNTVELPVDPITQAILLEDIPKPGAGMWADD